MKIGTQNIYGGNQQYADIIINNSESLNSNDKELVEYICKNAKTEQEKTEVLNSLEIIKSDTAKPEEKEKSKGIFKKFLESGAVEAGKELGKILVSSGLENFM